MPSLVVGSSDEQQDGVGREIRATKGKSILVFDRLRVLGTSIGRGPYIYKVGVASSLKESKLLPKSIINLSGL